MIVTDIVYRAFETEITCLGYLKRGTKSIVAIGFMNRVILRRKENGKSLRHFHLLRSNDNLRRDVDLGWPFLESSIRRFGCISRYHGASGVFLDSLAFSWSPVSVASYGT